VNCEATRRLPDGFEGLWIPRPIVELGVPPIQQMILAEVNALEKNTGCFASNAHFLPLIGVKERSVRKHISALEDAGHLYTEGRDSARRRMWLSSDLAAAIDARKRGDRPAAGARTGRNELAGSALKIRDSMAITRRDGAPDPGTICTDPASPARVTRHGSATERSMRGQEENTRKDTTRKLDSESVSDTHLRDDDGAPLATLSMWKSWRRDYRGDVSEAEQRQLLAAMVKRGFNGDELLDECISIGLGDFWSSPPRWVVPDHLRAEYDWDDDSSEGGERGAEDPSPF
jgi:hypothetical protein